MTPEIDLLIFFRLDYQRLKESREGKGGLLALVQGMGRAKIKLI